FFRNIKHYGVRAEATVYANSIREVDLPAERDANAAEVAAWQRQVDEIRTTLAGIEAEAEQHLVGGEKDDFQDKSVRYDILRRRAGEIITKGQWKTYHQLSERLEQLQRSEPSGLAKVLSIKENGPEAPPTHILLRGNPNAEGDEVQPGFPAVLSPPEPQIETPQHGQ